MKEQDIEELYRQNIETSHTPPSEAWQRIESQISRGASAGKAVDKAATGKSPHGSPWWLVAAGVVLISAAITPFLLPKADDTAENAMSAPLVAAELSHTTSASGQANKAIQTEPSVERQAAAVSSDGSERVANNSDKAVPVEVRAVGAISHGRSQKTTHETERFRSARAVEACLHCRSQKTTHEMEPAVADKEQPVQHTSPASSASRSTDTHAATKQPSAGTPISKQASPSAETNAQHADTPHGTPGRQPVATRQDTPTPLLQDVPLFIPNLLTPNGDGYNDVWRIEGLPGLGVAQVVIYTPQGRQVYKSNNYKNDFDGANVPDGNYIYTFQIKEQNIMRRGALVIKRQ
ncbi:MAG: gliding motility-associated C-terminal domain-containing protein [Bacteroidales bacterium]|nr:gliding motility-associated C-terminal domain-containing protein [Bacteroidales bacterium]